MFELFGLRLLFDRGDFPAYERFADQMKNLHTNLFRIREEFDERADQIAKTYYKEPYNIWVGSGILWGCLLYTSNVHVGIGVDSDRFLDLYKETILSY